MKRWLIGAAILAAVCVSGQWAWAQLGLVLSNCGAIALEQSQNQPRPQTVDTSGRMCTMAQLLASNSIVTGQVSIGTTATQIVAARPGRRAVTVINSGTVDVMVGALSVTTGNGAMLTGSKGSSMTVPTSSALYGVVGTGTQSISFLETY